MKKGILVDLTVVQKMVITDICEERGITRKTFIKEAINKYLLEEADRLFGKEPKNEAYADEKIQLVGSSLGY